MKKKQNSKGLLSKIKELEYRIAREENIKCVKNLVKPYIWTEEDEKNLCKLNEDLVILYSKVEII